MKKKLIVVAGLMACSAAAFAEPGHVFVERARVVSSVPQIVEVHRPARVCQQQEVYTEQAPSGHSAAGSIIGGVLGGLAGHQIGHGRGNTAATIAGAVAGAAIGDHVANNQDSGGPEVRETCRTEDRVVREPQGYRVTYRVHNQEFTDTFANQPGEFINVRINVRPQ